MNWPQYDIRNLQTYKRCKSYCLFLLTTWLSWEWLIKWAWWWQLWRDWGDCYCLLRAEASRYFTITIKHQPWLGLAGPGHTRTEELRVVTIAVCWWWLGARMTETNKQIPEPGDRDRRMSGASYSEFPHSLLWPLHGIQSTVINNQPHFLLVLHKDSRSRLWQCCSFYFSSAKQKMNICQHLVPGWHWAARSCGRGLWCDHEVLVTIVVSVTSYAETLVLSN